MNQEEIDLAEKIYQKALETNGMPDKLYAQYLLTGSDRDNPKKIKLVRNLVQTLVDQGLLKATQHKTNIFVSPSSISHHFETYISFLKYQEEKDYEEKRIKALSNEKLKLEIENLKLQISDQKNWIWKAVLTAVIIELVQFYFLFK